MIKYTAVRAVLTAATQSAPVVELADTMDLGDVTLVKGFCYVLTRDLCTVVDKHLEGDAYGASGIKRKLLSLRETISKTAFKKHLLEKHNDAAGDAQTCKLLKVEGADEKAYWLYLDMPVSATLKTLDRFLRDIWLECCGHESAFFVGNYEQLSKNTMVGMLRDGLKLHYEYDFGSTTELTITVVGTLLRPKQRRSVRLLGRNEPIRFLCGKCGKEADWICCECEWADQYPYFCEDCMESHPHDSALPIVNSPRMGVCGYCGEDDVYTFDPAPFLK